MERSYALLKFISAASLLTMLAGANAALAETQKSFEVSATIQPGCAVDGLGTSGDAGSVGTLDFGTDISLSTATHTASLVSTQLIRLRCTTGSNLKVTVNGGLYPQSNIRKMKRSGPLDQRLEYRLYSNSAMTNEISIGGETAITVTTANAQDIKIPIYARVILPGTTDPGTYTDTIQVTLTW